MIFAKNVASSDVRFLITAFLNGKNGNLFIPWLLDAKICLSISCSVLKWQWKNYLGYLIKELAKECLTI
jgi:hypothetical protein